MDIGQAAGIAAALCIRHGGLAVQEVNPEELVEQVRREGSFV